MPSQNTPARTTANATRSSFWPKLINGDYGLGKTFWLAWFLPLWFLGALMDVLMEFGTGTGVIALGLAMGLLYSAYFGCASVWAWRAANKHPSGWATTAKVWIGLSVGAALAAVLFFGVVLTFFPEAW